MPSNIRRSAQGWSLQARAEQDAIVITLRDHGPGILPGMNLRIFEKFVRLADPERHADGSGLGLAICKGIVEAHGGRIWVENAPDGGALFTFTLPLSKPPARERQPMIAAGQPIEEQR